MSHKKAPGEKIGNVNPFGLRLLPQLKRQLELAASANGRSLNSEITRRLEASLKAEAR